LDQVSAQGRKAGNDEGRGMSERRDDHQEPVYDRALLLHGAKRNDVLTLREVQQYGADSFSDPDYIQLYGMVPAEWYARGIRLLGRTAVECTRDCLGDRIGRDVASVIASLPSQTQFTVIDPFAGSCNTLYWILRHVARSTGIAFEFDPQVYELSRRNIAGLDRTIELTQGDYHSLLPARALPPDHAIIVFVAPPWGTALDETIGLDLRRTSPPITKIIGSIGLMYPRHKILFATQVYEKVNPDSLAQLETMLDWSELRVYALNIAGRNHGILLSTKGWKP
jgi:hypothetical protein